MEKLIVLGTGEAAVTRCFNTCFALKHKKGISAGGTPEAATAFSPLWKRRRFP